MTLRVQSRVFVVLTGALLLLTPAVGQRGGSTTSPPSGGNPGAGGGGGATQPGQIGPGQSPQPGTQPDSNPELNRNLFLRGRVVLEDGTPPPQPVALDLVCNGSPYTEGYTNGDGSFSITLGVNPAAGVQDASNSGLPDAGSRLTSLQQVTGASTGLTERQRTNCDIRVELTGYRSQSISLVNRRAMDDPNVGTIVLHRTGQSEGTMVSLTDLAAPNSARKAYEKGVQLVKKNQLREAQASFAKAVAEYPRYASAWTALGSAAADNGDAATARHAFEQAISADPKYVLPYVQLSQLEVGARQWKAALETSEKAFQLDSFSYPQAYFYNAVAHFNLHEIDAAEQSARRAQSLDTAHQYPQISHLMGAILAERRDYPAAAAEMRDYLKRAPDAADAALTRSQLEQLEKIIAATAPQAAK